MATWSERTNDDDSPWFAPLPIRASRNFTSGCDVTATWWSWPLLVTCELAKSCAEVTSVNMTVTESAPMNTANTVSVVRSFWRRRLVSAERKTSPNLIALLP